MDLEDFVGIPWLDKGRSYEGCDCYGVVFLAMRDIFNIPLPAYVEGYASAIERQVIASLIADNLSPWARIDEPSVRRGDVVLFREAGLPRHVGVVTERGWMLHMRPQRDATIEPYTAPHYWPRLAGIFRHEMAP